jgi:glycosyltransferase involved in cell wall biosynthesis
MESPDSVKIDLHLHSKYSRNPSTWILKKIGCPESFSEPLLLYQLARERGLTHVTITDHNQLAGSLDIAHLPNAFISEEVTTYFPEDRCKLHVLVYRIDEAIHREIQTLRENVFELVPYLRSRGIFHVLAHPLFGVNERLTLGHFEQCLLLFNYFELNGARDGQLNILLQELLSRLRKLDLEKLADRHNLVPYGDRPWEKRLTGGSDDHSTLSIGRQYTEVPDARTLPDFFEGLEQGRSVVSGEASSPASLARTLYSIAYQFYCHKFKLDKYLHKDLLLRLLHRFLHSPHQGESRLVSKVYDLFHVRLRSSKTQQTLQSLPDYLRFEIYKLLAGDPALKQFLKNGDDQTRPLEEKWFSLVNQISNRILFQIGNVLLDNLSRGNVFGLFQAVGSAGSLYFLMAPYFIAFSHFAQDRRLAGEISRSCPLGPSSAPNACRLRIAHFTDTFYQVNGVALTLQQQVAMAKKNNKRLTVITCDWIDEQDTEPEIKKFRPVGSYDLAEYPEFKLHFPPFLEMLQYCYQEQFMAIHTATPGPVGLAALAIARILKLPCYSTYHTSIPQYARYLTEDPDIEDLAWKYICWYYDQMDRVYVPSQSTRRELIGKGLAAEKIQLFARGIDTQRFHPDKRNGFFEARFPVRPGFKLLYVGRVSKEKNLRVLGEAYKRLWSHNNDLQLIIVGDGPYLKEFQDWMSDTPCLFTGYLDGEDLATAYASADLFLFPSSTDTFGNVILEAQASGLPVIVTNQGGPQENILPGETGVIVPADDPQALGEAVENLVADPLRLKRMGQAARQFMEDRSFEKAFQETWEMYNHPLHPGESILAEAV